jgi:hypothetical protein
MLHIHVTVSPELVERVRKQLAKEAQEQSVKLDTLAKLEERALLESGAPSSDVTGAVDADSDAAALKQSLLTTVLSNLQLTIRKIHLRYEDDVPDWGGVGLPKFVAGGVIINEVSVVTTDSRCRSLIDRLSGKCPWRTGCGSGGTMPV